MSFHLAKLLATDELLRRSACGVYKVFQYLWCSSWPQQPRRPSLTTDQCLWCSFCVLLLFNWRSVSWWFIL